LSKKKTWWYQATEKLLYTYKSFPIRIMALMQRLELIREQMLPSMVPEYELREGTNYSVSSPVERAVMNRLEGNQVQKIEQKIKNLEVLKEIVEISIDTMLNEEQKQLVQLYYYQERDWRYICDYLGMDDNTFYRKKNEIVKTMAWCFGYLPDEEVEETLGLFMDQALWQGKRE